MTTEATTFSVREVLNAIGKMFETQASEKGQRHEYARLVIFSSTHGGPSNGASSRVHTPITRAVGMRTTSPHHCRPLPTTPCSG